MSHPAAELYDELEELGEATVQDNLAKGVYGPQGDQRQFVEKWLRIKAQLRADELLNEQISIAREAVEEARISAVEARNSKTLSKAALVIAVLSVVLAVFA